MVATLLAGSGSAELTSAVTGATVGAFQALAEDGVPVLVVRGCDLGALGLPAVDDVPARLDVIASAPLPDMTLPRAHTSVAGWVSAAPVTEVPRLLGAQCVGDRFGEAYRCWPDARLLTVDVAEVTLHWWQGCADVDPSELATGTPDPLAAAEGDALAAIDEKLSARLLQLVRSMGRAHHVAGGGGLDLRSASELRAVGLDRWGLVVRCRVGAPERDRSIRLPFPGAVSTVDQALETLALLLLEHDACPGGCPHSCVR